MNWTRVSKKCPCKICEKHDWCTISDGSSCCMRVKSSNPMRNGGWLHKSDYKIIPYIPEPKLILNSKPSIDIESIWKEWTSKKINLKSMISFSESIGVDPMALHLIGCAWAYDHNAWAFPMKDGSGKITGIRLRNEQGKKWAVKGSKQGIFIPLKMLDDKILLIVEGPTDTASALTLGFSCIGRPSCLGCESLIIDFIRTNKFRRVVIVADNDAPGLRGACKLQGELKVPSLIWTPPCKDLREFLSNGGTKEMIESSLKDLVWQNAVK